MLPWENETRTGVVWYLCVWLDYFMSSSCTMSYTIKEDIQFMPKTVLRRRPMFVMLYRRVHFPLCADTEIVTLFFTFYVLIAFGSP